jgi:hypothetical protein
MQGWLRAWFTAARPVRVSARITNKGEEAVDTTRVSTGQLVSGASGLGLFLFLFLKWYGGGGESLSAWKTFSVLDIALAAIGLFVAAVTVLAMTGGEAPVAGGRAVLLAGVIATFLTFFFALELTHGKLASDVNLKVGGYLSFLASIGIAVGGYMAEQEPAPRPRPTAPPPSAPPPP